ncbi:hypothetical protein M8C21_031506 [Ambrosia artemisiifolia]|uniref:IQ domain-containing protein IQM3-like n=1 Tax=Ambrosia artemisiifolia TaxID=4212 RepID=A0AAD5BZR9_AMBAR|nr:hypothetical protein M8C21_031506 [Ambrosia artemisiifolia]
MEVESSKGRHTGFDLKPIYPLYSDEQVNPMGLFSTTLNAGGIQPSSPSDKAAAAMKVQKVYRSYRTRRLLADSAVVAEELWWQAIDFARLNHSTVSFFNFDKPESPASRWNRISLNASKVGKGLSVDSKAHKLAFQHWIEAIDPQHRYGHSLHIYYEEWCKADAGQPFFYWLDVGDGKEVDLKECPRSKLRKQCIKYLGPQEREHYEYIIVEGKIIHRQTGLPLDTNDVEKWIFVMSTSKRLYAGEKKKGSFHHSSFLAGGATFAAGRLEVENGILKIQKASEESEPYGDKVVDKKNVPSYKRSLSGGLRSPKSDVPKKAILERINSKKMARSYQLGHQLSLKWSTGAGPRIGCIADYPIELRLQALEFTNLSPRGRPSPKNNNRNGWPSPKPAA